MMHSALDKIHKKKSGDNCSKQDLLDISRSTENHIGVDKGEPELQLLDDVEAQMPTESTQVALIALPSDINQVGCAI